MNINRIAVAAFFFVNGFFYGNWTSRIPEIQRFLGINNSVLGTLLFTMALGAIFSMPFSGFLTTRFGSRRITQVSGFLFCAMIAVLCLSENIWFVGAIFLLIGISNGAMDVAMNGQAVYVERSIGKAIMSSFHAMFSIGMAIGAAVGAGFSKLEINLLTHFGIVSALGTLTLLWAAQHLMEDAPSETQNNKESPHFQLPTKAILPLGIIAFCCMTGEGSMSDWSANYLKNIVGTNDYTAAFGVAIFSGAMTIGRVFGDYFTEKFGKRKVLFIESILAMLGLAIAIAFPNLIATFLGFFLVGLGLSTIVPIVYSTAGNTEGISPSVGIAMATTIGYAGFFIGPPIIGFLADTFDLRVGLGFSLLLFVAMALLVGRLKRLT